MRRRWIPAAAAAAALALAFAALALADTVYVKVATARVLDKPDAFDGRQLARVNYGDRLERTGAAEGGWTRVRLTAGGRSVEGFVRDRNLSTEKPPSTRREGGVVDWLAGGGTDDPGTAGARGLTQMGREYTKRNNLEAGRKVVEEVMDKMKLDARELEKFQREGRLGDYAGGEGGR